MPIDHAWFYEHTQAYLAEGLDAAQRADFEAHAAACAECAADLADARAADQRLTELFQDVRPPADLEERIVTNLRRPARPSLVHPMVRRAAAAVAAVLVLGAVGYVGSTALQRGTLPQPGGMFGSAPSVSSVAANQTRAPASAAGPDATLDRHIPEINFDGTDLGHVIDSLRDATGANIFVNWRALEAAGINKAPAVNLRLKDVKLSKALSMILADVGGDTVKLDYNVDNDGVITISTADDVARNPVTRSYDIRDLLTPAPPPPEEQASMHASVFDQDAMRAGGGPSAGGGGLFAASPGGQNTMSRQERVDSIVKLIQETADPTSWRDAGGTVGAVRELGGTLIVTQTGNNQHDIAGLLEQLRQARGLSAPGAAAAPAPANPNEMAQQAAKQFAQGKIISIDGDSAMYGPRLAVGPVPDFTQVPNFDLTATPAAASGAQADAAKTDDAPFGVPSSGGHVAFPHKSFVGVNTDNPYTEHEPRSAQRAVQAGLPANSKDDSVLLPTNEGWDDAGRSVGGQKSFPPRSFKPTEVAAAAPNASPTSTANSSFGGNIKVSNGILAIANDGALDVSSGQTLTAAGFVGGSGGSFKGTDAGTVVLGGANSFNGLNGGTLVLTNANNAYSGATIINAGGTLQNGTADALPAGASASRTSVAMDTRPKTAQAAPGNANAPAPQPAPAVAMAKIIRNGDIEFEVDNFDSAYDRIARIAAEEGGAISSTESEKLANGKTRGTIVVRVIPDNLDRLVLKLRSLGELKSQHISAQDVTKQYTDVESQLRAARAMEERLLDMIKNTKGNVKDLLAAEKELANWRGFIEQYEGQLRYYNNLIALSTLNITLYEKDMATPSAAVDAETISMGVETQDVAKSRTAALAAIDEVQGRVIVSQLKQYEAGQLAAVIVAEVPPEAAGPLTDRLRMLGNVSRLDIDRKQTTQGNVVLAALKVDRQPTRLELSLYNLADVAPRQTTVVSLACADVETAYRAILAAADVPDQPAGAAGGGLPAVRIVSSSLNTQNPQFTSAAVSLEARGDRAAAIEKLIRGAGEVMKLTLSENPDTANVTRSKQGFSVTLTPLAQVTPRESRTLQVAANDVSGVYYRLLAFLQASPPANTPADSDDGGPARVLSAQLSGDASAGIGAALSFEIPRSREIGLEAALAGRSDSDVLTRSVARASGDTDTVDSKIRYDVSLIDAAKVPPRQTTTMAIEVGDVEQALGAATQAAVKSGGSALDPRWARDQAGASSASVSLDVPVAAAGAVQDALERLGTVRVVQSVRAPQVPDGTLARARFELTLGNAQQLIEPGEGVDSHFREGLRTSVSGLLWSFQWIVIGLLLIGPWAVLAWIARKLWRRARRNATTT